MQFSLQIEIEWLYRITAPHFTAGFVWKNGRMTHHAPILKYMKNWDFDRIDRYCIKKAWILEVVKRSN